MPLRLFYTLVAPLRGVLGALSNGIVRLCLGEAPAGESPITEEAFRNLVDMSKKGGVLWESEREFIHNIFEFEETPASEVMTPRTDMFCLQTDQSLGEILKAVEKRPQSRIPVFEKDKDDIVGILYCKDLLRLAVDAVKQEEWDLKSFLRKPYFIPETKKANDLFREFRFNRIHLAIVVDEYGGVAGLVTMEDLLEELFGEIQDEHDTEEPQPRELDENTLIIPAKMPIEEFNQRTEAGFPLEEYDTMGGLVFGLFGRLPSPGAKVSYMGHTFTVEQMMGTRILELRVESQPHEDAPPQAEEPDEGGRD
jgi:putative hemolysin